MELNLGTTGAKRTRYYHESPDALLRRVVEKNPDRTEIELEEIFEEQVMRINGTLLKAIIAYWFTNRFRALQKESMTHEERRELRSDKERKTRARVDRVKAAAVKKITVSLLKEIAPGCGKPIGRMSKRDCRREGGWFLELAGRVGARQTVQTCGLSDQDLLRIYKQSK